MPRQKTLLGLPAKFQTWKLAAWLWPSRDSQLSKLSFRGAPSSTTPCPSPPPDTTGLPDLYVWVTVQVLGAGGALGGPAHTGVNFGGKTSNLGAAPHDWGFAKKVCYMPLLYQQNKTPPLQDVTWGMRILAVWNRAAKEQIITNNPS